MAQPTAVYLRLGPNLGAREATLAQAKEALELCRTLEEAAGRVRGVKDGPRTLHTRQGLTVSELLARCDNRSRVLLHAPARARP